VPYSSQLWRLQSLDLTADEQKVQEVLGKEPNLLQVTVTPDAATGTLWVAFFARSDGETTGARIGQRAMAELLARPELAGTHAKPEWGGVVYPEPDPGRPETFPPVATIEWVTAMRHRRIYGGSDPNARWYRVTAQIHGIDSAELLRSAAAVDGEIKRFRRVPKSRVSLSGDGSGIEVRFLIAGVSLEDATREAFHLADALVTVALDGQENCRIEIQDVSEAEPQKN
jgi:hypothetical protein